MADTEKTLSDELREAAKTLRETAAKATRGPWEGAADAALNAREEAESGKNDIVHRHGERLEWVALVGSGTTETADARWICLANPLLAEPLASWLESAADWCDQTTVALTDPNHVLHHACGGVAGEDCSCFAHPLAVARVLNGTAT